MPTSLQLAIFFYQMGLINTFTLIKFCINSGTQYAAIVGGSGLTDVIGVLALVIFINWYDLLFGVEAFRANPLPHMDPIGWLNNKYDHRPMQHTNYSVTIYFHVTTHLFLTQVKTY
jgi:hypothetical protein